MSADNSPLRSANPSSLEHVIPTFPASDGYPIRYRHCPAKTTARGVVVCIHGIQSHSDWYLRSCDRFAGLGFETFFMDRRGSGRNEQDRGHCAGYRQLVDDLERSIAFVAHHRPGLPITLVAISWGGKLALAAFKKNPGLVDRVAFVCPGWFAKVSPPFFEKVAIAWSFFFNPRRLLDIPLNDPALFTMNAEKQAYIRDHPLNLRKASARMLVTSRILDRVIATAPAFVRIPALLVLAEHDRIIDNSASKRFFERFAATEKKVIEYQGAHHTLEFEPDPDPITDDVARWFATT